MVSSWTIRVSPCPDPQPDPERLFNFVLRSSQYVTAHIAKNQQPAAALVPTKVPFAVQLASAVTVTSVFLLNLLQLCAGKLH